MPAAAIPSICRHRSHLLPPWKHVPASFSFQLSHRGLDAFQEWRTDTSGKVSLGRQQQAPGKGICCLRTWGRGCQVGPTLWVRARTEFDEQHHPTSPYCCWELCEGTGMKWFRYSDKTTASQPLNLWQGLLFHALTTRDGNIYNCTLCNEPFCFIQLSRHQQLWKWYSKTTW